ncbi:MAG: PAS domain S-box protein [Actinobacteria bacterium]|nr:MAG: PAS domain S-box protein [Actinomycetota bacterium]
MPMKDHMRRIRRLSLGLYALLCVVIVVIGVVTYRGFRETIRTEASEQLVAIAELKVTEIAAWRLERLEDGRLLQRTPGFGATATEVLRGEDGASRERLLAWLAQVQEAHHYAQVSLIDAAGNRVVSLPAASRVVDAGLREEAQRVMASGEVGIADFHRDDTPERQVHLSIVVPVIDAATGDPVGVVALKIDPTVFLYPYISQWPGSSPSAETLLVERSGNDVVFLNDLRFQKDAALNTRIPLTSTNVPAVQIALGNELVMDGVDYRGVQTVAATRKVPDSPWGVVARIDAAEVYAPVRARLSETVVLMLSAMLVGLVGMLGTLRMQELQLKRDEMRAEAERAWLASAIDRGLNETYVFDAETLRFEYANLGALRNLGYSADELCALTPLDLKPELTPAAFEALLEPLRTGAASTSAFETVHRRKDGTEYPIEARVQLTNRGEKDVFLALVSDISERRAAEQELEVYRKHLETLVAERTDELQAANEELAATNEELAATNEELAATNEELAASNEELASLNEEFESTNEELEALYQEAATSGRELERLNRALAEADSAKSDFLASMSHELRTPLNSVIGFSDIMLQGMAGQLNAEQHRQMEMINNSGKHLLALINDVLDLSKVEAGRMEADVEMFDLCEAAREVVESVRPQAAATELALTLTCPEGALEVASDERLVKQVLFNLLSNAIKFTVVGSVTVSVAADVRGAHLSVSDTGPGIAREDLERIFDAFTQVRSTDRRPDGTGLGLAVSSKLAALLGGEITVQSAPGVGSTFALRLPLRAAGGDA